jgi:hypothetical protein
MFTLIALYIVYITIHFNKNIYIIYIKQQVTHVGFAFQPNINRSYTQHFSPVNQHLHHLDR